MSAFSSLSGAVKTDDDVRWKQWIDFVVITLV